MSHDQNSDRYILCFRRDKLHKIARHFYIYIIPSASLNGIASWKDFKTYKPNNIFYGYMTQTTEQTRTC